jgi:hypothetical protein
MAQSPHSLPATVFSANLAQDKAVTILPKCGASLFIAAGPERRNAYRPVAKVKTMYFHCRVIVCLSMALMTAATHSTPVLAEESDRIGHFATADGELGFVLDLSGETPRQRFDNSPEILVLKPVAAPRGDTIYKRSSGEQVLRMNPYGGLTYFPPGDQMGVPMVRVGDGDAIVSKTRSNAEVLGLGVLLEQQLKVNYKITVQVTMPGIDELKRQKALDTLGDAIENTQIALDQLASVHGGPNSLQSVIAQIEFDFARNPGVELDTGVLSVHCAPAMQLSGRPSSLEIASEIEDTIHDQHAAARGGGAGRAPKSAGEHSYDYRW